MTNILVLKKKLNRISSYKENKHKIKHFYRNLNHFSLNPSPLQHFVLIARGRSGSTCLLDILDCHPQILTDPHTFFDYSKLPLYFPDNKLVFSSKNIRGYKFNTQARGMLENAANAETARRELQTLIDSGVKVIYLERNNVVKRAISSLVAKSRKQFNFRKDKQAQVVPLTSLHIDPEALIEHIKYCEAQNLFDRSVIANLPHICLTYEEDLAQETCHQEALDKICQFLKIDSAPAITRFSKVLPNSINEYISNYQELRETVANSQYAEHLAGLT